MSIKQLNPYLIFDGQAEQAIRLYERALGATTDAFQRFGDMPGATMQGPERERVVHALVHIGPWVLMISDSRPGMSPVTGGIVHICLDFDDEAEMRQKFEALAATGKVEMALQDTFWGAVFGSLTDAHGVSWMFNCEKKKG